MWHVVLPMKGTDDAKSRLHLPASVRSRVVDAMAADTLDAVLAAGEVTRVSLLTSRPGLRVPHASAADVDVIVQPRALRTLDQALRWFASSHTHDSSALAVVMPDLPALRTGSVTTFLQAAAGHRSAMVTDSDEDGTTMLTSSPAGDIRPHFGVHSAAAHLAAGVVSVVTPADARRDVDTTHDLAHARALGLGPHTRALLAQLDLTRSLQ